MNRLTTHSINEMTKSRFFEAVKAENITEILHYLRNEQIEVWNFMEDDNYTGIVIFLLLNNFISDRNCEYFLNYYY